MNNINEEPKSSRVDDSDTINNSGMKEQNVPIGVKGWSWGAFLLNWIWAIGNKSYIGILAFIPYIGLIVAIYLGFKGRELAWKNKRWDSLEHFNEVQRKWTKWSLILILGTITIGILAAVLLPTYRDYAQ